MNSWLLLNHTVVTNYIPLILAAIQFSRPFLPFSLLPFPRLLIIKRNGLVVNFRTPRTFGGRDLIGQYASRATHAHYIPTHMHTVTTVVQFVSGCINARDLLAVGTILAALSVEQPWVSFVWRDDVEACWTLADSHFLLLASGAGL